MSGLRPLIQKEDNLFSFTSTEVYNKATDIELYLEYKKTKHKILQNERIKL